MDANQSFRRNSIYLEEEEEEEEGPDTEAQDNDPDFIDMFKLIEEPESLWKEVANKQGVKVYSKNIPNSPAILLRAWGYLKNISVE